MRKNRLLLMMSFAALMVALGTVVFAPFVASNGLRIWLHWQAHRQQLKIELGKTSAPLLRPVSIERIHVTSEPGSATRIDFTGEQTQFHLRLIRIVSGKGDGIRTLSINTARIEIRRDYSESARPARFNWGALQSRVTGPGSHTQYLSTNGVTPATSRRSPEGRAKSMGPAGVRILY